MSDRSMYSLTVDSVGVHPDGRVVRCPSDSQTGEDYGTIEGILGELQSLRKHVAEMSKECGQLKTENERLGAESAKRLADMHYLDVVLQGARAKQDELKADADHLRLLLERKEKASGRVADGLWATRKATGRLCEIIGIPACDDRTDKETAEVVAERCRQLIEVLGVQPSPPQFDSQDAVDAHRAAIERRLSQFDAQRDRDDARLVREAAAGQLKPELNAIAVGNALIQPTSMRIELPGGVVITIPHPKD